MKVLRSVQSPRGERIRILDKLVPVSLPRAMTSTVFQTKSFDGRGNWPYLVKEQIDLPEINLMTLTKPRSDIVIVTTANTDEESRAFAYRGLECLCKII